MVTSTVGETLRFTLARHVTQNVPIVSTCIPVSQEPLPPESSMFPFLVFRSENYYVHGRPSAGFLSYASTNETVLKYGKEALEKAGGIPLIAPVNATDPFVYIYELLENIVEMGFSGVQNYPSVGILEGNVRKNLEASGMGFDSEVRLITDAKKNNGLFTIAYVFNKEQAIQMVDAQADIIILHLGITTTEFKRANPKKTLASLSNRISDMISVITKKNNTIPILLHGGPLTTFSDLEPVFKKVSGLAGYCGTGLLDGDMSRITIHDLSKLFIA